MTVGVTISGLLAGAPQVLRFLGVPVLPSPPLPLLLPPQSLEGRLGTGVGIISVSSTTESVAGADTAAVDAVVADSGVVAESDFIDPFSGISRSCGNWGECRISTK